MSVLKFDRTDEVTIEFKACHKPASNVQIGIHGGFHHVDDAQLRRHFGQDLLHTPEATFGHFVNDITAYELGDGFQAVGSAVSFPEANLSLTGANTKHGASTFRITLGTVQGAQWEVDVPITNGNLEMICGFGATEPCTITGRDTMGSGTSNIAMNNIGFGNGGFGIAGTAYLDDIVVTSNVAVTGDHDGDGDADGNDLLWYQISDPSLISTEWDPNYGTGVGSIGGVTAVPEPGSSLLALCGLVLIGGSRRRD